MKTTKVTYQKTYSIGPYLTERIGFEADITESESVIEALVALNAEADKANKILNPHLYQEQERGFSDLPEHLKTKVEFAAATPVINIQDEKTNQADYIAAIESAETLEDLKTYKTLASSNPDLYKAYCKRIQYLTC